MRSFELLCVAAYLQGASAAFAWYYRFAAADASPAAFKPRAISYVMAGGIAAGIIGPEIAKRTVDWFAPVTFLGVYLATTLVAVLSMILLQALRIPKLTVGEQAAGGRPLSVIMRQPTYIAALISSMLGYGVMTLVMSATPLAMLACGFNFNQSATVIQVHIIAMFLPSFFTGHLIQRFGARTIVATGALIQAGCAADQPRGHRFRELPHCQCAGGIGVEFHVRRRLDAAYEHLSSRPSGPRCRPAMISCVYATTATAAALAGFLQQKAGWAIINIATMPLMATVVATMLWLSFKQRRMKYPLWT